MQKARVGAFMLATSANRLMKQKREEQSGPQDSDQHTSMGLAKGGGEYVPGDSE